MVRKNSDLNIETKPAPFGGTGKITVRNLLNGPDEMYNKGRVFAHTTVYPESRIGLHMHKGDSETYYILSVNVNHFFRWYDKQIFMFFGNEFLHHCGKQIFMSGGKHFFT